MENIIIAGAGALGALYGHKFIKHNKNILFLADGERKNRLEKEGFVVNGEKYSLKCTGSPEKAVKADLFIAAVKYHHLKKVTEEIRPFIDEKTVIISVMNGIDSEDILREELGYHKVYPAVVLGMDAVRENNNVGYTREGKVLFGQDSRHGSSPEQQKIDIEKVKKLLDKCDIACEVREDMYYQMWYKFMINTGINQVSSVLDADYGFMQDNQYAREVMDETMREVIWIANAEGTSLSETDIVKWYDVLNSLGRNGRTSMGQDIEAGRKTEVEMFSGKIIELGKKHSIDVPCNFILYNLIKAKESCFNI